MRYDLNRDWTVESPDRLPADVVLPHDAMVHETRDPSCANGKETGYFPGGTYTYRRTLAAPEEWRGQRVSLLVEGAYHRSTVRLNGSVVGGRPSGYAEYHVDLDGLRHGEDNQLEVVVDNADGPNSRWYSGSGLYRPVWLDVEGPVRLTRDGIRIVTRSIDDRFADVEVAVEVEGVTGQESTPVVIEVELRSQGRAVATWTTGAPVGDSAGCATVLRVPDPLAWSSEQPHLYDAVVTLRSGRTTLDERHVRVGLRTVEVDAVHGLRVNGRSTLLRGACVHHDSGILGAATFHAAERRRARILKDAGYNAIRSAHNPMSRAFLDACDEVGLYVMDELTDLWFERKNAHDYASDFPQWWRDDLASMVVKDRNHPSVIMYSLGNENGESATAAGVALSAEMAAACRALDPSRPVTAGVNLILNGIAQYGVLDRARAKKTDPKAHEAAAKAKAPNKVSSALFNAMMARAGSVMNQAGRLRFVDRGTRGVFGALDVAGYNYGSGGYRVDARRHPGRVIVGSETLPIDVVRNWSLVEELPHLIGDFVWTGWDYLGEAGLGGWGDAASGPMASAYPALTSAGGVVDLTGLPGPMAAHARAAWGIDDAPGLFVRPPDRVAAKVVRSPWRTTDAIASWAFAGFEGAATEVVVFSSAAQVELLLDGRSVGTRPAGRAHDCQARFRLDYTAGELTAVARTSDGVETGRSTLVSSVGRPQLHLSCDRAGLVADGQDLAFVTIEIVDEAGTAMVTEALEVRATVTGAGCLAGLGSGNPAPTHGYTTGLHELYRGRALAIVRSGFEPGDLTVTVATGQLEERSLTIPVTGPVDRLDQPPSA